MKTEKSAPKGAKTSKKSNKNKDIMIKDKLLLQALKVHIPVLGWGEDAVSEAALELNYDVNQALALFGALPEGLLLHCADWADRYMAEAARAYDIESLRVRDRVALLLRLRFEVLTPYKEAIRSSLPLLAQPTHLKLSAQMLWHTVDLVWNMAGDTSTDHNIYTKRGLLSGVYTATLIHWLADKTEDHESTWAFLERRIENVLLFGKFTSRLTGFFTQK